jgi:hypothetical protein
VQLYEAQGNTKNAAEWRSKLEAARAVISTPATTGSK